jgi:hypothetical protein
VRRHLVGSFVIAALCAVTLALVAGGATAAQAAPPTEPLVPLNSSFEQAGDTWLLVPMGHLSSFLNTFWQLFVRSPTASGWVTVTPPGVADNGGLAVTAEGDHVLAGFLPSQDLRFSPLGSSTDSGQSWQGTYFPEALRADPDALSAGADGAVLALGRAKGATVLVRGAGSSSWRTLTTLDKLDHTRAGGLCGIARLTAVAVAPDGDELVGATCLRDGGSAVFALDGDTARPIAATIGGAEVSVLRLVATPNGVTGLFAAESAGKTELRAGWLATGARSFALSAPLALGSDALVATGTTALGGVFVLVGGPHGQRELAAVDPGSPEPAWDVLPPPPRGTVGAALANGRIDAVTVHNSILIDYTLDPGNDTWVSSQRLQVPIQYGSSS